MAWILGLDLGRTGGGALDFAKWFTTAGAPPRAAQVIGVHVLEEDHLLYALRDHHLDEVVKAASAAVHARIGAAGAAAAFSDVRVIQGVYADGALEEARKAAGGEGVIVGRAAPSGGVHVVRIGAVGRRLLRTLASPVVVVPPDLGKAGIGDGPVIALTNLHEDAVEACRFAAATAKRLGRRWLALHVARGIEVEYLPLASSARASGAHQAEAREKLDVWLRASSLQPDAAVAAVGSAVGIACETAVRERSPLLVTGSRRLSTTERAFQASFGSALAAVSPVAVAIVPPPV
jgi:nucleotide-binding universal stress UspA family protein